MHTCIQEFAYLALGVEVCLGRDERLENLSGPRVCSGMQGRVPLLRQRERGEGGARRCRARRSKRRGRADGEGRGTGSMGAEP